MDLGTLRALLFGLIVGCICIMMNLTAAQAFIVLAIAGAGMLLGAYNLWKDGQ
jgi:uncharacterized protein (DUF58 family)